MVGDETHMYTQHTHTHIPTQNYKITNRKRETETEGVQHRRYNSWVKLKEEQTKYKISSLKHIDEAEKRTRWHTK